MTARDEIERYYYERRLDLEDEFCRRIYILNEAIHSARVLYQDLMYELSEQKREELYRLRLSEQPQWLVAWKQAMGWEV
jgi:hypothetical protein